MNFIEAQRKVLESQIAYNDRRYANALVGNVSGEIVAMDDVSPLEHKIPVKLSSKNLISSITARTNCTVSNGIVTQIDAQADDVKNFKLQYQKSNGEVVTPFVKSVTELGKLSFIFDIQDNYTTRITFGLNSRTKDTNVDLNLLPKGTYVFSCNITNLNQGSISWQDMQIEPNKDGTASEYTPYVPANTQVTVKKCGKNLIPYPYPVQSQTISGVTFTVNENGTITADGVPTSDIRFDLIGWKPAQLAMKKGIYYTLSGCPKGGGHGTYKLVYSSDPGGQDMNDYGDGATRQCTENAQAYGLYIFIGSGTAVKNLVFKPQFEVGARKTPFRTHEVIDVITTTVAEGVELTSVAPNTTIATDKKGVVIDCSFNRDTNAVINKLFEEIANLKTTIVELGGTT